MKEGWATEDLGCDLPMVLRTPAVGGVVRVNRAFVERLGIEPQELDNAALLDWIHPADHGAITERLQTGSGRIEARHRTGSGEWTAFDWDVREHQGDVFVLGQLRREQVGIKVALRTRMFPDAQV